MPLEGLWWVEDGNFDFTVKDNWYFTLMIMHPDAVTHSAFAEGLEEVRHQHGDSTALHRLRLDRFEEGLCVQTMHVGPYATEPATLERMQAFMRENGLRDRVGLGGKHHEIYLGDPRRAAPDKLKTCYATQFTIRLDPDFLDSRTACRLDLPGATRDGIRGPACGGVTRLQR